MATIMIVEDDEQLNEVLQYNLSRAGYEVVSILNGDEALRHMRHQPPDLVLMDVMLPGADGWQVTAAMQKDARTRSIPVIFFTARGAREDFDQARQFPNFAGYFIKPYATSDVLRYVDRVLKGPAAAGDE